MGSPNGADRDPWISSSGEAAHPDSSCGGGGPGASSHPGVLSDHDNLSGLPHPRSHNGSRVLPYELADVLLAQNDSWLGKPPRMTVTPVQTLPVTFKEFNNKSAAKYVEAIKGSAMGVHPQGNFPWVNAVELIFEIDAKVAKKMKITGYRARQKIAFQEMWQRELKDGKVTAWKKVAADPEGPDDPDPGLVTTTPAIIAYHDAPGFMAGNKDVEFSGPANVKTSKEAVMIFLRQDFVGWIDGSSGARKHTTWKPVSDEVKWHSNQSLVRNIFSQEALWGAGEGSEIELGHTQGEPKT